MKWIVRLPDKMLCPMTLIEVLIRRGLFLYLFFWIFVYFSSTIQFKLHKNEIEINTANQKKKCLWKNVARSTCELLLRFECRHNMLQCPSDSTLISICLLLPLFFSHYSFSFLTNLICCCVVVAAVAIAVVLIVSLFACLILRLFETKSFSSCQLTKLECKIRLTRNIIRKKSVS